MFALDNPAMQNDWIERRLEQLPGKSKSGLAKAVGLPPARVTDIIQGKRNVAVTEIPDMSLYLEMDVGQLLLALTGKQVSVAPYQVKEVAVRGAVQAGHWVEALEWHNDDWYSVPVPDDPRYPNIPRFGLEVRGPSMNRIYPEGTVLICVHKLHMAHEPRPGQRVVVERRRPDGLVEATVKELRFDDGKAWLWPDSTHPEHQAPIPVEDGSEAVEIVALVTGSYRPE